MGNRVIGQNAACGGFVSLNTLYMEDVVVPGCTSCGWLAGEGWEAPCPPGRWCWGLSPPDLPLNLWLALLRLKSHWNLGFLGMGSVRKGGWKHSLPFSYSGLPKSTYSSEWWKMIHNHHSSGCSAAFFGVFLSPLGRRWLATLLLSLVDTRRPGRESGEEAECEPCPRALCTRSFSTLSFFPHQEAVLPMRSGNRPGALHTSWEMGIYFVFQVKLFCAKSV